MSRKTTALDVAHRAGVSRTAVSMVINGSAAGNIAPDKQERIRAAMIELDYVPNSVARNLRSRSTQSVGILTDEIASSPWAGRMLLAATDYALQRGYVSLHIETGRGSDSETFLGRINAGASTLARREVDGLAFFTMGHEVLGLPDGLTRGPFAVGNCKDSSGRAPCFVPDDYQGGFDAAQHLLDVGHRDLVMLAGDSFNEAPVLRVQGFRDACQARGVQPQIMMSDWGINNGYQAAAAVFEKSQVTAMFCINDRVAVGAYLAAAHAGLRVPQDISIIGFDDEIQLASELTPALTTMALPHAEMGIRTMTSLLDQVDGKEFDAGVVKLPCPLIVRGSVAPPS